MDRDNFINRKTFIVGILGAGFFVATATLLPGLAAAQLDKVRASMAALKAKTAKLGAPRIEGTEALRVGCRRRHRCSRLSFRDNEYEHQLRFGR